MPATATITTYYTFVANTKARASQVNTNLSTFRGHLLPFDPNTVAAADNTYDVGSAEYSFRRGYFGTSIVIDGDSADKDVYLENTDDSIGGLNIIFDSSIAGQVLKTGCPPLAPGRLTGYTTTALVGGLGRSNTLTVSGQVSNATSSAIVNSTITISVSGRPVLFNLSFEGADTSYAYLSWNTSFAGSWLLCSVYRNETAGGASTEIWRRRFNKNSQASGAELNINEELFQTAGTYNYWLQFQTNTYTALLISQCYFKVRES